MNDNRFDLLEFGDAPKAEPNKDVFSSAGGLQVREGSSAKQDDNGNWFNAIGLQSTETHRHVAKVWQDKCVSLEDFYATLKKQQVNKIDVVKP